MVALTLAAGGREAAASAVGLRVLMVTPRYLPEIGGVERHVHEVATRIAAAGGAVTVLTTDLEGRLPASELADGVEVRRVRAHPRGADWRFAPGIGAFIAASSWDVVHIQSYHTFVAPLAMAAAARHRIPYVVTFHGGGHSAGLRNRARRAQRTALRPLLARAAALVAVAAFEIEEYAGELRLPRERFRLISNGVELPAPPPGRSRDRAPDGGRPLIASVGRLERYKGHQRVIAALPHVRAVLPSARLWVAGSGPYERRLREQVAQLGLGESVEIFAVAADAREQMADRLSQVDLVVLLSDFETQPIAALEALALGRPLLVAAGSGLGELAERGLARAVAADAAPESVAAAILRELSDPLARGPLVLTSWDECAAALVALYRQVAGSRA